MILLNNLTLILLTIIDFLNSWFTSSFSITSLLSFLINFTWKWLILIIIIYLASRAQKILDNASKTITIATGGTVLYNNWVKGEGDSSGSSEDKDENKKDKKDESIKQENKEDEINKPTDQNKPNEK